MRVTAWRPRGVVLLLACIALLAAAPTVGPRRVVAASGADARILESRADAHFLDVINFHLAAESEHAITAVQLFWHAADEPVLSAEYPDFTPGTSITIDDALDMRVNYLPP